MRDCRRDGQTVAKHWELHINGVGVTQSRTLLDAEPMVRDHVALAS